VKPSRISLTSRREWECVVNDLDYDGMGGLLLPVGVVDCRSEGEAVFKKWLSRPGEYLPTAPNTGYVVYDEDHFAIALPEFIHRDVVTHWPHILRWDERYLILVYANLGHYRLLTGSELQALGAGSGEYTS
jgi:hypothetical protein